MESLSTLDGVVLAILLIAIARGALIGLIREGFSIMALAAACVAVRYGTNPAARWLNDITGGEIGAAIAPWIAGAVIVILSIGIVGLTGRWLKQGAKAAGLGWADRLGGSALGAAEGALLVSILVVGLTYLIGRDHPALVTSRSLAAVDELQEFVADNRDVLPKVASPPPAR
jgi:uncharacterized membrane protein required for colicin V production